MCSFYLDLAHAFARQAPYSHVVCSLKSEVPFVTSHSHPQRCRITSLPPRASAGAATRFARRLQNYEFVRILRSRATASFGPVCPSGGYRDRTGDIQLAKLALSQLS